MFNQSGKLIADLSKNAKRSGDSVIIEYQNFGLPQGLYLIRVKTSNTEKTFKVIKK